VAAIAVAWYGGGAWSLAMQQFVECAALSAVLWWQVIWWPKGRGYRRDGIQSFITFGNQYATSSVFFWITQNADTLLVGAVCGKHVLGFYSQAYNLVLKPITLLTVPVTSLMLPSLSRVPRRFFSDLAIDYYWFVAMWSFPAAVGVGLMAKELILILGGPQWLDAAPLVLALSGLIATQGLINICGSALAARDKTERLATASIAIALLHVLGFIVSWQVSVRLYGTTFATAEGVALSWSVVAAVILVPYLLACCRAAGIWAFGLFSSFIKPAVCSAIMGVVVLLVRNRLRAAEFSPPTTLALATLTGGLVYAVLMRKQLAMLLNFANDFDLVEYDETPSWRETDAE
jgi:PST family polysaccharide transporter